MSHSVVSGNWKIWCCEVTSQPKQARGRPRKHEQTATESEVTSEPNRARGRPPKRTNEVDSSPKAKIPKNSPLFHNPKGRDLPEGTDCDPHPVSDPTLQQFHTFVNGTLHILELAKQRAATICRLVENDATLYDRIVEHLNNLPHMYASQHTHLEQDVSVLGMTNPLLFQTFKPVQTTGDGSCLFHALSLTLTGTETCTDLLRLLAVYALVKYKATMMSAFRDAFPLATEQDYALKFTTAVHSAASVTMWGTDYHLFALCLLLNRPIFHYNTNPPAINARAPSSGTLEEFAQRYLSRELATMGDCIYCTSAHRAQLSGGDVHVLPLLPLCVFNQNNVHWVAMLPRTQSALEYIPIPQQRILAD